MDFFGLGTPILETEESLTIPLNKLFQDFFYEQNGLTKYLVNPLPELTIKGYIIEVKSRSTKNYWSPFQYSFSSNQEKMFLESKKLNLEVILCGVTFSQNWDIAVVFTNLEGKILSKEYFMQDQ
ncbi:MAG: hypothetical protein KAT16_10420 [Candidatus Heimdallarchaeota archaeon]|nr:hypothetical protein [Candidatus Heimdallarchaeota archaeon]